jgi:periplasmic divalent cation tolerance protein
MSAQIVFVTCPDMATATEITRTLVEERLAACGNILPGVRSIYRWEGKIEAGDEVFLILKTDSVHYPRLEKRVTSLHPYEVPEVLAFDVTAGLPAYLRWMAESLE